LRHQLTLGLQARLSELRHQLTLKLQTRLSEPGIKFSWHGFEPHLESRHLSIPASGSSLRRAVCISCEASVFADANNAFAVAQKGDGVSRQTLQQWCDVAAEFSRDNAHGCP
jgi:hypothetical protein